jgi:hypothetical protein
VQTIFVLRLVFMVAHHYTTSGEGSGLLTTWAPVFNNLRRTVGCGCGGGLFRERAAYRKLTSDSIGDRILFLYLLAVWSRLAGAG